MARSATALLINDTRSEFHHGCSTVCETIFALSEMAGIDIVSTAPVHRDWRSDSAAMEGFRKADIVIVNGEGTIHHDKPAGAWLLAAGAMAKDNGKKAVLINATWQANSERFAEMVRSFDIVSVRESASQTELSTAGIEARRIPDLALYRQPAPAPARTGIAYTDSVLGDVALDLYRAMRPFKARPVSLLYNRTSVKSFLGLARRLLPDGDRYRPGRVIDAFRAALAERSAQVTDRDAFAMQVASSRLVVTGRFHMLIYCLATRTPMLAIGSNTHKNMATLMDSGLEAWRHVEIDDIDAALLERAAHWHPGELERLDAYVAAGRKAMETLFLDIRELA